MKDDGVEMSTIMTEKEPVSNLIEQPPVDVTPNATSNTSMLGFNESSNKDSDELKKTWEKWWNTHLNYEEEKTKDNKQKQLEAQIKFIALYEKEKQSRGETDDIPQKPLEDNKSSDFSKTGGKSRKNKGKGKTKRNTKRKLCSK